MDTTLLDVLLAYDAWATRELLVECTALSPERFGQELGVGPGSLARTAAHLVGAEIFFAGRFYRRPVGERPDREGRSHTAQELLDLFDRAAPELQAALCYALEQHAFADPLQWTETDTPDANPNDMTTYGAAIAHMFQHGVEHRTEAIVMLRQVGVTKRLDWTPFAWEAAALV